MRRDDDYIRDMLFKAEASEDWRILVPGMKMLSPSPEENKQAYHATLLVDAGLLAPMGHQGMMFRMTNAGHDWLNAVRDDTVWSKTKTVLGEAGKKMGEVPLAILGSVAMGLLKEKLAGMGIPLG